MRRKGTRKEGVVLALVIIGMVGMMAVLPGLAAADPTTGFVHRANPPVWFPNRSAMPWLFLLDENNDCLSTIEWTASTGFAVLQGYFALAYDQNPIPLYPELMDPTTTFRLTVDGTLMHSALIVWVQAISTDAGNLWVAQKMDLTTFRNGMTGVHTFTGEWYLLGNLDNRCVVTVTFT